MTYKEIKDRLSKCEYTLKCLQKGTYKNLTADETAEKVQKVTMLKESLEKQLAEADKGIIYTDDESKAKDLADQGANVKLTVKERLTQNSGAKFSVEETKSIAKVVGKAVAKALKNAGDELAHMKATDIEENSFEIYVEYKKGNNDQFSFYVVDDRLHLVDFSFDKELVDVGVKPSGEPVVNVDVLANELVKHFKSINEMKPGSEEAMEHERFKNLSKKDQEAIEKIRALMAAERAKNENDYIPGLDDGEGPRMSDDELEGDIDIPMGENESEDDGGDIDIGHKDDEPDMLKQYAYDIAHYAAKLYKQLDKYDKMDAEVDFPNWWQSKVIMAKDYMSSAQHYLEFEEKQPAIDKLALEEGEEPSKSDMAKEKGIASQHKSALDAQEKKKAIAKFIANMMKKGIVSKDKKILDKDAYKKEFDAYKKTLNERVGSLSEFINLLVDRSENNDTPIEEEALEVIEALADHFGIKIQVGGFVGEEVDEGYYDNYEPKHFDICPGAEALRNRVLKGEFGKQEPVVVGKWTQLHDELFAIEKLAIKKNFAQDAHVREANDRRDQIIHLSREMNIPGKEINYLKGHVDKIIDIGKKSGGINEVSEYKVIVNGKEVDIDSIEIDGVDRSQGYDDGTVDAYAEYAMFVDGTELSDAELDDLTDNHSDLIHDLAIDSFHESAPGFKHDCAAKVVHEKYGKGTCIPEKHTLVKEGKKYVVTHYDVLFESGKTVEDIPVSELEIKTQTEHWHKGYKKKKKD